MGQNIKNLLDDFLYYDAWSLCISSLNWNMLQKVHFETEIPTQVAIFLSELTLSFGSQLISSLSASTATKPFLPEFIFLVKFIKTHSIE